MRVSFDPPLVADEDTDGTPRISGNFITKRYKAPIAMLAPDESMSNIWQVTHRKETERTPERCTVRITYTDDRGKKYDDLFALDADAYNSETAANPSDKDMEKRTAQALESVVWELWRE